MAMEVVGKTAPLQTAVDCVRLGGQVGLVGNLQPVVELALQKVVTRELKLIGSCGSSGEYPQCIELMASWRDPGRSADQSNCGTGRRPRLF